MNLIYTRQQTAARWNQHLTPDVYAKVKYLTRVSRHVEVRRCQLCEFEVELNGLHVGVRLDEGKCDYNAWQMTGIPYVHALACITFIVAKVYDYVDRCFTTEVWRRSFAGVIHPIPSRIYWPHFPEEAIPQPPIRRKMLGRPKVHRNKKEGDNMPITTRATTVTSKLCKQIGHNKRGCPQNPNKGKKNQLPKKQQKMVTNTNFFNTHHLFITLHCQI